MLSFIQKNNNRQPLAEILPVRMPLGLCIEPINLCNFKCVQCPVSLPSFKKEVGYLGKMDMYLFKKIINDIQSMGKLNNLNLYGDGEPLLNPNLIEMIRIIKQNDIANALTVTTNASLLTKEKAKEIINTNLDYLRISIYSIYDERFKYITQSKYKAGQIYENIKEFVLLRRMMKKDKPFVYVKILNTYNSENQEFLDLYKNIADESNIENPMNWNGYNGNDLISKIDPNHHTDETNLQGYYGHSGCTGLKKICTTPFLSLNIKVNGDVGICIVDWNKGTKVGNIKEQTLSEIWFGEKLRQFREMHIQGRRSENVSCRNCRFLYGNPDNMDNFSEEKYKEILNYKG